MRAHAAPSEVEREPREQDLEAARRGRVGVARSARPLVRPEEAADARIVHHRLLGEGGVVERAAVHRRDAQRRDVQGGGPGLACAASKVRVSQTASPSDGVAAPPSFDFFMVPCERSAAKPSPPFAGLAKSRFPPAVLSDA